MFKKYKYSALALIAISAISVQGEAVAAGYTLTQEDFYYVDGCGPTGCGTYTGGYGNYYNDLIGDDDPLASFGGISSQYTNSNYAPEYYYNTHHDYGWNQYGSFDDYGYTYQAANSDNYQYILPGGSNGQLYATENEFTGQYELYDPSSGLKFDMSASDFAEAVSTSSNATGSYGLSDISGYGFDLGDFGIDTASFGNYGNDVYSGSYNSVASNTGGSSYYSNYNAVSNASTGSSTGGSFWNGIANNAMDGLSSQASSSLTNYLGGSLGNLGITGSNGQTQSTLSFGTPVNTGVTNLSQTGNTSSSFMSAIGGAAQIGGISSLGDFYGSFADASFLQGLPGGLGNTIGNALDGAAGQLGDAAAGAASDFFSGLGDSFDLGSMGGDFFGDFSFGDFGFGDFDMGSMLDGFDLGGLDFGGFDLGFDMGGITDGLGDMLGGFDVGSLLGGFDLSSITGSITEGITGMLSDTISGAVGDLLGSIGGDLLGSIGSLFG